MLSILIHIGINSIHSYKTLRLYKLLFAKLARNMTGKGLPLVRDEPYGTTVSKRRAHTLTKAPKNCLSSDQNGGKTIQLIEYLCSQP